MKTYRFAIFIAWGFVAGAFAVFAYQGIRALPVSAFSVQDFLQGLRQQWYPLVQRASPSPTFENQVSPLPVAPSALAYEQQIEDVVSRSTPSVVSITISKNVPVLEQYYVNPFQDFGFELPQGLLVPQYRQNGTQKQVVGGGSGFVISQDGLILTNKHVVADASAEYTVLFNDGTKLSATVLGRDPTLDIAVLKVSARNLTPLPIGNSEELKLGQTAIVIGNALGEFRNTVSVGAISGLARTVAVENEVLSNVIQTDAAINPGNSGGPLLNLRGEVIGINTAMAQGAQSIGFAIPINQVKRVIKQAQAGTAISAAYLGVWYQAITPENKTQLKVSVDSGVLVLKRGSEAAVQSGSPAEKAGIREGDIIVSINGQTLNASHTLAELIAQYAPGDIVTLKIVRNGQSMDLRVTLAARP